MTAARRAGDRPADGADRTDPADSAVAPSYEAARDELLEIVRRLEAGGTSLEESLALWERGEQLAAACQSWLDGARERLAKRRPEFAEPAQSAESAKSARAVAGSADESG